MPDLQEIPRTLAESLGPAGARRFARFQRAYIQPLVNATTWPEVEAIRAAARREWERLRRVLIRHDEMAAIREELDALLLGAATAARGRLGLETPPVRVRAARRLKRLAEMLFDASPETRRARYAERAEAWTMFEAEWEHAGIRPRDVHALLQVVGEARRRHETGLRARLVRPTGPALSDQQRRLQRLLAPIEQEVTRMRHEVPRVSEPIAGHLQAIRRQAGLDLDRPLPSRPAVPRGRPGESWLEEYVVTLVAHFRRHGVPWGTAIKWVYDALVLDAHGDVVTPEGIKRLVRRVRTQDPARFEPQTRREPGESEVIRPRRGS